MERHGKSRAAVTRPEDAFAKALREIRVEHGVSQESLGFESGYHRTYMSMLERGKVNPSLRTILSLAAVLDVPAADIVRRVEAILGKKWRRPEKSEGGSEDAPAKRRGRPIKPPA
jgi:transcriptional regulator with XRE-family HTH domain